MSIRIHELAKRHNMEGKEMLAFLKERGYVSADTRSVSSTVNKIYEEEVDKEFAARAASTPAPVSPVADTSAESTESAKGPVGTFVKSREDITREREEAKLAASVAARGTAPTPS
ncbi:MAG TPA: translation initiation factor IF-2, partial [Opitutaceae bacterium]|nr:translation initiation factor IF-2 [Opitutaceae bacterium]